MKTLLHVVGARPNFMKVAPLWRAVASVAGEKVRQLLVHTGQHYDVQMSDVFFRDLALPAPDVHLGIGSGSQTEQTAKLLVALEKVFLQQKPDLVSVVGDVTSTLAAALVAAKLRLPLAHVEAGLRSYDRAMPEEVNRVVTDQLSDFLLTPSPDADANLTKEGISPERIFRVGNVMIDTLRTSLPNAQKLPVLASLGLTPQAYAVCTLHRPSNVDDAATLRAWVDALGSLSAKLPVVFPVHPRTRARLGENLAQAHAGLKLVEPMGYLEFLCLTSQARLVLTDSGGLQEETTALGVPCLTLRDNTERPVTVTEGTNQVVGAQPEKLLPAAERVLQSKGPRGRIPALWDGKAAERISAVYARVLGLES